MMTLLISTLFLVFSSSGWVSLVLALSSIMLCSSSLLKHDLDWFNVNSNMLWDTLAISLIMLSMWILFLSSSPVDKLSQENEFSKLFMTTTVLLLITLLVTFSVTDFLHFYILFETSLIPTFMLILGCGVPAWAISSSGVYMLIYTLLASLPLLLALLVWKSNSNSLNMVIAPVLPSTSLLSTLWLISFFTAFSVKLPLYIVHLWLPKAHVEAPVAGSMMLAGVLLKLGGYGLIRLSPKLNFPLLSMNWMLVSWAMVGGVLVSLICLRQTDIKFLIALSSVAHMSMVMGGILTFSSWGLNGAIFIMMVHGFCSSGLFCIANMAYERTSSRSLLIMKGMQSSLPSLTLWWFLLAVANMAAPPSLNLLGEMKAIIALFSWSWVLALPLAWLTFFAAVYSLYMYSTLQQGKPSSLLFTYPSSSPRELLTLSLHWIPLNVVILSPLTLQYAL
uniref:NADH-ubiquinone oxidoreductase chain 4 n=2 Tax=Idotea baltica TaxID=82763 RepID=Q19TX5_9CRUS|nr:NADH dehydrogenase subunit 4 [Idotea baltica]